MSKHLHKSASYGVRGLMAVLCFAFSVQWASAQTVINTAVSWSGDQGADKHFIVENGGTITSTFRGGLIFGSITVPAGTATTMKSSVQYASWSGALHGGGIINFQQISPANSREGFALTDELFEGEFRWTAARSMMYLGGINRDGAYGMPNGRFVFKTTGSLYGGYVADTRYGGVTTNTVTKIGEIQCEDAYSGSALGSSGFQLGGTIKTTWEIGGRNTDSYFSGKIVDGQMKGGYTGVTALRKVGTGSLTLPNGGSSYTQGTEIREGGIYVNSSTGTGLGTGAVTVAEGAFLGGNGLLKNLITGSGALRPGAGENQAGELAVSNGAFTWGGGYVDIDLLDNDSFDTLEIVTESLVMPGNTVRVYVAKDFTVGAEFPFLIVQDAAGTALPWPQFSAIEVVGVGPEATKVPVFDLDYLNETGKLKIVDFSMFSKTPRKLAGICDGAACELAVETLLEGVSFEWKKDGATVASGVSEYSTTEAGMYTVTAIKGSSTEDYEFEVREGHNPSTIAAGTSYRTDGDSIFVTPASGETLEAWQWYMAPVDNPTDETPLDFEWNPKYVMTTSGYYAADIYSELGCMTHLESTLVRFEPGIVAQPVGNDEQLCEGAYVTLQIEATTQAIDGIINYQWHYLGDDNSVEASEETEIAGATASSYTARQSGYYLCYLSVARGYTYSEKAYVDITAIAFSGFPTADVNECASDHVFSVAPKSATNGSSFESATYRWFQDGAEIAGATESSYTADANGAYQVEVTVGSCVKTTKVVNLALSSSGEITKDLELAAEPIIACAGEEVSLSIEAEASSGTLSYQWYKDGAMVRNATSASYSPVESGTYYVTVSTDGACATNSSAKEVTFLKVPTIRTQPFAEEYIEGYAGSLCDGQIGELSVFGVDVTSYQWFKDGEAIEGADKPDFETTESGTYYVVLTNDDLCMTKSDEVTFTAKLTPASNIEFDLPAVCSGMLFDLVPEYDYPADSYAWYRDDELIEEATVSSYATRYNGDYYVAATNECGTGLSNVVEIRTFDNPSVLVNQSYSTLTATISDPNPATVKYQWTLDEEPIQGATNASYMVKKRGNYAVIVTNENGCSTTSTTRIVGAGITAADPDLALQQIAAYPNPSTGIFRVQNLPVDAQVLIQVDNLTGATIFSEKVNGQEEAVIDLTSAPAGMYFIKVIYGDQTITKKVTIER
ncbi:MAG: T9SS type A sorting domain-containing protein [Bacteroidales bacterium]|nr:T9SS type A sorting domain-containing protein [Bacteroidales bacterium]